MENEQDPQQEQQEQQENNKSGRSNPIDQINQGYKHARRLQKSFSQPKSGQNMLKMAQDPMGSLTSNIPGLGGKGGMKGLPKSPKQLKTAKNIVQVASKIPPHVWIVIGIILLIMLVFAIILSALSGGGGGGGSGSSNENIPPGSGGAGNSKIAGFSLILNCTDAPANGDNADCQITYTYDTSTATVPLENIAVYFDLPPSTKFISSTGNFVAVAADKTYSWKLFDPANSSGFTVSITNTQFDINADAAVYAKIEGATPGGSTSGNSCTQQYEGTGYCSHSYLTSAFGGDASKALIASMICQDESGSDPFQRNVVCPDYSIGLFQINLVWHCNGAYSGSGTDRCTNLASEAARATCEQSMIDPEQNITKAFSVSSGGGTWTPWSTWPGVQSKLSTCGVL
ncbi:MAG: hypothetical protein KA477_01890 [Candidatus Levybacteria bacterium]|nr:hypothetical protein [Candidatus Levybacteria bacterium]